MRGEREETRRGEMRSYDIFRLDSIAVFLLKIILANLVCFIHIASINNNAKCNFCC